MPILDRGVRLETERLTLRPPERGDFMAWAALRRASQEFLAPWEPRWMPDQLTRDAYSKRVRWARRTIADGTALPLFLIRRDDGTLVGAITLDNVRRGPSQAGTLGYWTGESHARKGYMSEAVKAVVHHAFTKLDISRIEAACLPKNVASIRVLEGAGFKYEGVAQSYLQINGRWRTHVLYANLRSDRRGVSDAD